MAGGTTTKSGLTVDQKRQIRIMSDMLNGVDANGAKHGLGYGMYSQGATPYSGPLVGDLHPGYEKTAAQGMGIDPLAAQKSITQAISPLLNGQKAIDFKNLQAPTPLQMGQVNAPQLQQNPTYNFGAMSGNGNQQSTYNYVPGQVKSNLDNSQFTQDYFNQGIKDPLLAAYQNDIAPKLTDAGAGTGSTFSTRTQVAKQKALSDLQTQMAAQLSGAVRQDNIERSQQDLQAGEFNVNSGLNNAQFKSGQDLQYAQLNNQNSQYYSGLNSSRELAGADLNSQNLNTSNALKSQNALNFGQLNSDNALKSFGLNSQNKYNYDTFNTNTSMALGENALNRRLQAAALQGQSAMLPFQELQAQQQLLNPLQSQRNAGTAASYQEFQRTALENSPWLKYGLSIAGLNPNTIVQQQPNYLSAGLAGAGIGASVLGGLGTGAAAGSGLFGAGSALGGTAALGGATSGAVGAGASAAGSGLGSIGLALLGLLA